MTKFAILIAVEEYLDPNFAGAPFAARGVKEFSRVLATHGFENDDQLLLIDHQATKAAIESQVKQVAKRLRKNDLLYLYYAGHGFSNGSENHITGHDTLSSDWVGTSIPLAPLLAAIQASNDARIVFFLDCREHDMKTTPEERGIAGNLNARELKSFFDDAKHRACFAACRADERSHTSQRLRHGIWTFHLIEAFGGDAPLALERGVLTTQSLQDYLQAEVARTLRKEHPLPDNQTPWRVGDSHGDLKLADLRDLLQERHETAIGENNLAGELSFKVEASQGLRTLVGWKKDNRIPDRYSDASASFVARCANEDLTADLDQVYASLRRAFRFTRRELDASEPESGMGTIITPYFDYAVRVTLSPDQLQEVLWTRTVNAIKASEQITSEAFAEVFDHLFDTLEFAFPATVNIEDFIDAVEAADIDDLTLNYDRAATYCEVQLLETPGRVTVTSDSISIVHDHPQATQRLIESFDAVRKLIQSQHPPLISFAAPMKKR